jgi:hypothetical protein
MATLFTQNNMPFPASVVNSGNIPAPSANSVTFALSRTGLPAGRAADNKLCDVIGWYSTNGGSTWSTPTGKDIQGGVVLGRDGNPLATDLWTFNWSGTAATHIKFQYVGYVAFTSPTVTITSP